MIRYRYQFVASDSVRGLGFVVVAFLGECDDNFAGQGMSDLRSGVRYDPIVVSAESTVVAEYFSQSTEEAAYQSEAALERGFISRLQSQACEYLPLTSTAELIANLRVQLEALNAC